MDTPPRGCCGYVVRSSLPLRFLRDTTGDELVIERSDLRGIEDGRRPLLEWTREAGIFARIYGTGSGYLMWLEDLGWFEIDAERSRVGVPASDDPVLLQTRLWGIPVALCALSRGDLVLHSAAVEVDGAAVLLLAPSHHGKTTLAAAFYRRGHRLLAEDMTYCRPDAETLAFPGPALVRVRHDMARALSLFDADPVGADDQRVYLEMAEGRRGDGSPIPVAGVILIRGGDERVRLDRVDATAALRDLWPMSFNLPTAESRAACFERLAALAGSVPIFDLHRPVTVASLDETVEAIAGLVRPDR